MATKKMTAKQKQELTLKVGKEVLDLVANRGCELKVFPVVTPDGRIAAQMLVSVKE